MKRALITGASGEIGQAIIHVLEGTYYIYAHTFQNQEAFIHRNQQLIEANQMEIIQANLANLDGIDHLTSCLKEPIDLIIHCAGAEQYGLFTDLGPLEMDYHINLHLMAPMKITQYLLPEMIRQKSGQVIFITSIWGTIGASNEVLYSTLKGAQNTFVKSLAKEVAPSNIRVNGVAPGIVNTRMMGEFSEEEVQLMKDEIPLGRFGEPSEVANLVKFLSNDKSSYMTGCIIPVSGGWQIT